MTRKPSDYPALAAYVEAQAKAGRDPKTIAEAATRNFRRPISTEDVKRMIGGGE